MSNLKKNYRVFREYANFWSYCICICIQCKSFALIDPGIGFFDYIETFEEKVYIWYR